MRNRENCWIFSPFIIFMLVITCAALCNGIKNYTSNFRNRWLLIHAYLCHPAPRRSKLAVSFSEAFIAAYLNHPRGWQGPLEVGWSEPLLKQVLPLCWRLLIHCNTWTTPALHLTLNLMLAAWLTVCPTTATWLCNEAAVAMQSCSHFSLYWDLNLQQTLWLSQSKDVHKPSPGAIFLLPLTVNHLIAQTETINVYRKILTGMQNLCVHLSMTSVLSQLSIWWQEKNIDAYSSKDDIAWGRLFQ